MRHHFPGFDSAVDLEQIDLVQIEQSGNAFSVVITTKSGAKTKRHFRFHDSADLDQVLSAREDAKASQKWVERYTWWRLLFAKITPHFWTWLASVGVTTWLTGYLGKLVAWLVSKF